MATMRRLPNDLDQLRERVRQNREALATMLGVKPPERVTRSPKADTQELQLTPPPSTPKGEIDV